MSNVIGIPAAEKSQLAAAVEAMKRDQQAQVEYLRLKAKLDRELFTSYQREGFTDDQALDLVASYTGR